MDLQIGTGSGWIAGWIVLFRHFGAVPMNGCDVTLETESVKIPDSYTKGYTKWNLKFQSGRYPPNMPTNKVKTLPLTFEFKGSKILS